MEEKIMREARVLEIIGKRPVGGVGTVMLNYQRHMNMERVQMDYLIFGEQEETFDKEVKNLSNTWWLNYIFFSQMERERQTRPLIYHRWGGLGNHRYQVGFSGDTFISWASLDYQTYFNSTASNVLYGYWSHDIGGHQGVDHIDPELYVRWMQFGAFSPILRSHSTKIAGLTKEPWVFSNEVSDILRGIIRQRYNMVPYIYTMAREAYETGLSLCRPMYYDYPETQEAYDYRNQYMFGNDVMVAPATSPMKDGYTEVKVWLPEGQWYEFASGKTLQGGQVLTRYFNDRNIGNFYFMFFNEMQEQIKGTFKNVQLVVIISHKTQSSEKMFLTI